LTDKFATSRRQMVTAQVHSRGITDSKVLFVLEKIPRHLFVPIELQDTAYSDGPVAIGYQQTISQPYIVGFMTELLEIKPSDKILEIGTGSGYQTAVLAEMASEVYTVEILPELHERAKQVLSELGYENVCYKLGDGTLGWPEHAPYDKVIVTASSEKEDLPILQAQLNEGGVMMIPIGVQNQALIKLTKRNGSLIRQNMLSVRFVPLIHKTGAN